MLSERAFPSAAWILDLAFVAIKQIVWAVVLQQLAVQLAEFLRNIAAIGVRSGQDGIWPLVHEHQIGFAQPGRSAAVDRMVDAEMRLHLLRPKYLHDGLPKVGLPPRRGKLDACGLDLDSPRREWALI